MRRPCCCSRTAIIPRRLPTGFRRTAFPPLTGSRPCRTRLAGRARAVYALGAAHPGVCQTAPARSPYCYEEDDCADDMELGAAELYALTDEPTYFHAALRYAALEPVSPWMGQDTARHYQWYPWHNNGHYETWRTGGDSARRG